MSDRYVNVKIQVEDMKSLGEAEEDADKEGVDAEERVPGCSPTASVSPDPATVTRAGRDATNTSILCKHRVKSRSMLGKDAKNSCGKRTSDMAMHGSVVATHVGTNLNRLGHERTLHVRGTGKILQGKLETNGNYVNTHPSKNNQETRCEDGKRKRRPVTVDISKAKTSLEALKLSITQLKWKEVFIPRCKACSREDISCIKCSIGMTTSLAFGHQCDDNLCRTMCHCDRSHREKRAKGIVMRPGGVKTLLSTADQALTLKPFQFPLGRRAPCDIYWHGVSFHDNENVVSGQVNKFPGMIEMLRKINLSRAVRTMQELFPAEYDFYPRSWILPEECQQFSTQIRMVKESNATLNPTFIVKPDGGSQGDGIYLIRDPGDLKPTVGSQAKQAVVQEYIQRPLLIDKLKFDIRLYVLLKSLEPLEIYIAKEGLTRFCTEPYQEPSQKNLSHVFMHLTNYSLNVHSGNFVHSDSQSTGSKRTLSSVLYRLAAKGVDIKKVWSDIIALVIKTAIAVVPELRVHYQADIPPGKPGPTCFQILGFDILLMKNLKPVLLEVNSNPSMRIEHEQEMAPGVFEYVPSPVDEEVKVGVIRDTLRLMDPGRKKPSISHLRAGRLDHGEGIPMEAEPRERSPDEGALPSLCLKQVYPKYAKQFNYLRLVERIAALFIRFLGVKGNMRLGPTAFRTFIRTCKLSNSNFSMASVDILYIDITRRWSGTTPESREAGMGLQAFVEAFFHLAGRRFKSLPLRERVASLLGLCEAQLEAQTTGAEERRSVSCSRAMPRGNPKTQTPGLTHPADALLGSPAPLRRASSQDYRLHQRLKPRTLRANVEN